ncbi:MAG: aminoglycoside phosphotransferase family protein, partial [bacterium]
ICKFPRNPVALASLQREAGLLHLLKGRLTLSVPDMVLHQGPPVFSAHPKLPGAHLLAGTYANVSEAGKARLAEVLGQFYAELHAIPVAQARLAGALPIGRWRSAADIERLALPLLPPKIRMAAEVALADYAGMSGDQTIYGFFDGHGWNMAFDPQSEVLNGIYDFADSGIGDLHQDFVYGNFIDADLTRRTVAAYQRRTGRDLDHRRIWLLTAVLRLSELAATVGDADGRPTMLKNAVDWLRTADEWPDAAP